jgi:hypothetical protein
MMTLRPDLGPAKKKNRFGGIRSCVLEMKDQAEDLGEKLKTKEKEMKKQVAASMDRYEKKEKDLKEKLEAVYPRRQGLLVFQSRFYLTSSHQGSARAEQFPAGGGGGQFQSASSGSGSGSDSSTSSGSGSGSGSSTASGNRGPSGLNLATRTVDWQCMPVIDPQLMVKGLGLCAMRKREQESTPRFACPQAVGCTCGRAPVATLVGRENQ